VDLEVEDGEFCVFVGPSGCGKSTLLRMIAGLEETTAGQISIGEQDVTHMTPSERGVAMVFQTYALYPHMSVEENMGFGLKMNKVPKAEITKKVQDAADILKLNDYMKRKPKALSGGQRQRVAIGRAIVRGPKVFLFDEPLSNLDAELRVEMRIELARLHKEIGATMIYVTHDQVEAMTLGERIIVMKDGKILVLRDCIVEQVGAPIELFKNPANKFVAGFIGSPAMNFLSGQVKGKSIEIQGMQTIENLDTTLPLEGTKVTIGIRPQHLTLNTNGNSHTVELVEHLGGGSHVHLNNKDGKRIVVEIHEDIDLATNTPIGINYSTDSIMLFDIETEQRIR